MDERAARIVDTAIELAERDGYAAVRLREVAKRAQVALGTVYKRFRSKEEILVAAMTREGERLVDRLSAMPPGETRRERAVGFYQAATDAFVARPKLARAILRAIAGGPGMTGRVASLHALTTMMLMAAIEGKPIEEMKRFGGDTDTDLREVALILQQVWFAALVGWAGGLHDEKGVVEQIAIAARRLLPDD